MMRYINQLFSLRLPSTFLLSPYLLGIRDLQGQKAQRGDMLLMLEKSGFGWFLPSTMCLFTDNSLMWSQSEDSSPKCFVKRMNHWETFSNCGESPGFILFVAAISSLFESPDKRGNIWKIAMFESETYYMYGKWCRFRRLTFVVDLRLHARARSTLKKNMPDSTKSWRWSWNEHRSPFNAVNG